MALITERYASEIAGVLTCYDRMIIQGYIAPWSHADGMTSYLNANRIKIFDYQKFCEPLTTRVRMEEATMLKVYCYNRCTTCKKALKWLDDKGFPTN